MQPFHDFIEQYVPLTNGEWDDVRGRSQWRNVTKNHFYLRPGQVNGEFVFIEQGALRVFQTTPDGQEYTAWIAVDYQSFCDLAGFRNQSPTRFSVQALADSTLITISYADMQGSIDVYPLH